MPMKKKQTRPPVRQPVAQKIKKIQNAKKIRNAMQALSPAGINFLKCAFAAPDFSDDQGAGLPLGGDHRVLLKKHRLETTLPLSGAASTGTSFHYVIMSTPGQAVWITATTMGTFPAGDASWAPANFPDCFASNALFSNNLAHRANSVNAFRYTSLCAEVKDCSSLTASAGTVLVQKISVKESLYNKTSAAVLATGVVINPIKVSGAGFTDSASPANAVQLNSSSITTMGMQLEGLEATGSDFSRCYSGHVRDGAFAIATRERDQATFKPILEGMAALGPDTQYGKLNGDYLGCDDSMDALYFRIDVPANVSLSVRLRVWACVEYMPVINSSIYEFSRVGPPRDELALTLYYKYAARLPIAVVAAENDFSWRRLWDWVKTVLGAASFIPGPAGVAAGAIGVLGSAIEAMVI